MADDVSIRPVNIDEVSAFVQDRDDRLFFRELLKGRAGILLFAFRGGEMLGHVFVRWEPAEEPELRDWLPGVPLLQRLRVMEPHLRTGIARQLIGAAERLALAAGHHRVALGVHPDNTIAIRLYEGLFFTAWGDQTLTTFREHVQEDGSTVREEEPCLVYVKNLG